MNASAYFRKHHQTNEFILQVNGFPAMVLRLGIHPVDHRQGIDAPAASLVNALFKKERIQIWRGGHIGPHHHRLFPDFHDARLSNRCWR